MTNLFYSKTYLRNKFRLHQEKNNLEAERTANFISIIAETINEHSQHQQNDFSEGKTREQLLSLGFKIIDIQNYFEFKTYNKNSMRWFLKDDIVINNKKIKTISRLSSTLRINNLRAVS